MSRVHYVGFDIHKKFIAFCVKTPAGIKREEGVIPATRRDLDRWAAQRRVPWIGAMEATLFTGWIYDHLKPRARELKVAHPLMLRAITAAKKKNDRKDAETLADLLRTRLLPEAHMAPPEIRELRRILRFRLFLVRVMVRFKNKTAGLLMEVGASYDKKRLHGGRSFRDLMARLDDVPPSIKQMARDSHDFACLIVRLDKRLVAGLRAHPLLNERVERLMTIPGVGEITALTWALEIDDPRRFASRRKAISYCGLCAAQKESAGKSQRAPISKQRNKHLQSILVEAAKLVPRHNSRLKEIHERELARGNKNRATLEVARRLVSLLLAIDKSGEPYDAARFESLRPREERNFPAPRNN